MGWVQRSVVGGRRSGGCVSRGAEGVTVAEFALVAPMVFLLVFGLLEGARVFSAWLVLTNEAREGARVASVAAGQVADPAALACARVTDRARGVLELSRLRCLVQAQFDAGGNLTGLTITLTYSVDLVIPIARTLYASDAVPIAARATARPE